MRRNPLMAGMVAVPIAFVIVIGLGYELHARFPNVPDLLYGGAGAIALIGISLGIAVPLMGYRLDNRPDPEREARLREIAEEAKRRAAQHRERRRLRVAQLLADPAKQKYAQLVGRGEEWSDEKIAYHEDRNITGTCPHLQPIERAMRQAGIATLLVDKPWRTDGRPSLEVTAQCCVNEDELKRQRSFPESVRYAEGYDSERSPNDNPWAHIACSACGSRILVAHSDYGLDKSWFPCPPADLTGAQT